MKHKIIAGFTVACLLVTLGVFSVGGVYAFQATDTPTSTITAVGGYIPTVNSTQALNLDCNPGGTPLAWGSLTPDGVWSVLCSHCMSTLIPSSTAFLTATPTLGAGTPSPTVTATASPTATPAGFCSAVGVGAVTVSYPVFGYPTDGDVQYSVNCYVTANNLIVCDGHLHAIDTTLNSAIEQRVQLDVELFGLSNGDVGYYVTDDYADLTFYGHFEDIIQVGLSPSNCQPAQVVNAPRSGTCNVSGTPPPASLQWLFTIAGAGAGGSAVVHEFYWHTVISFNNDCTGGDQSTPTVTPTSSVSYCQVVNGGGDVPDSGFEFNGITFGSTACFDIGPIPTWDFGFLVVNVNIPWIAHLCLTNIDLGVIQAFGVSVSLLTISYVWGIAWAIRNLFTS